MKAKEKDKLTIGLVIAWAVWVFSLASLLNYIVICEIIGHTVPVAAFSQQQLELTKYVLFAIAVFMGGIAYLMRKRMTRGNFKSDEVVETIKISVVVRYVFTIILSLFFVEAIGTLGVAYYLMSGDIMFVFLYVGIAIIAMLYFCPKMKELKRVAGLAGL